MEEKLFEGKYDYDNLRKLDVISKALPLLNSGSHYIRADGKIATTIDRMAYDVPWAYVHHSPWRICSLWHSVYFPYFKIIPSKCQQCWKVVARPQTVVELFELYEYQLGYQGGGCKCGIEERQTVDGNYGGYFYNDSMEQGAACLEKVQKDLPHIPFILKRACTEFEQEWGDSTQWEVSQDQKDLEALLDSVFVQDEMKMAQTPHMRAYVIRKWIHKAVMVGDKTYLRLTGGVPLVPKLIKYDGKGELPWQSTK